MSSNASTAMEGASSSEEVDFVAGPLPRTVTSLLTTPDKIRDFVKDYSREHYFAVAQQSKNLIEKKLKNLKDSNEEEVQARVTFRAKTKKSLEEKLKLRALERDTPYQSYLEIRDDIKDLAGVRIVLYTPNQAQRDKVKDVVRSIWPQVKEKRLDGSKSSLDLDLRNSTPSNTARAEKRKYVQKHFGYQAVHYRAHMTKEQGTDFYDWEEYDQVEIQVVSALGHAWAEAGHDVLYKTYAYGPPSEAEERILDALSGLVSSGDLLLEQFRELVTKRTYARWGHRDELAIFLRQSDVLEGPESTDTPDSIVSYHDHFGSESSDILFRFLVKMNSNYPLAIRNALKELNYPEDPDSKLVEMLRTFEPSPKLPEGFLAPFCLILHFLQKERQEKTTSTVVENPSTHLTIMMDAMILLQTFSGSPAQAKHFLQLLQKRMTAEEMESINFVLSEPDREKCFDQIDPGDSEWIEEVLKPAWYWFQKQASDSSSACGIFFRLAAMGVPAKEVDNRKRLIELKIHSLSRANTLEDHYDC